MLLLWLVNANVLFSWLQFRDALRTSDVLINLKHLGKCRLCLMAPVKGSTQTTCFWFLLDFLVQLMDIALVVGLGAPLSPV